MQCLVFTWGQFCRTTEMTEFCTICPNWTWRRDWKHGRLTYRTKCYTNPTFWSVQI